MSDYYDSQIELLGDVGVLRVAGETDLHTAPQFRRDLAPGGLVARERLPV